MIETTLKGILLRFETNDRVFSPAAVDQGTLALLSDVVFKADDKVLDLGCGYGVVGILAARLIGAERVVLADVSPDAVELTRRNARLNAVDAVAVMQSDGFQSIEDADFTLILSNPPYHADFSVAKKFIEGSYRRLKLGGRLYLVTKRLDWYKNKLISVFGGVKISRIEGYFVFMAEKRLEAKPKKVASKQSLSRKLARKKRYKPESLFCPWPEHSQAYEVKPLQAVRSGYVFT